MCTHLDASTDRTLVTMDLAIMICMVEVILYRDILRSSPVLMWEACSPKVLLRLSGRLPLANDAVQR